jgi:hypothetical protein
VQYPDFPALLERVQEWPLAFEAGSLQVYCNPQKPLAPSFSQGERGKTEN